MKRLRGALANSLFWGPCSSTSNILRKFSRSKASDEDLWCGHSRLPVASLHQRNFFLFTSGCCRTFIPTFITLLELGQTAVCIQKIVRCRSHSFCQEVIRTCRVSFLPIYNNFVTKKDAGHFVLVWTDWAFRHDNHVISLTEFSLNTTANCSRKTSDAFLDWLIYVFKFRRY